MDVKVMHRFFAVRARLGLTALMPAENELWGALHKLLPQYPTLGTAGLSGSGEVSIYAADRQTNDQIDFPSAPDRVQALLGALETLADLRAQDAAADMWRPRICGVPKLCWIIPLSDQSVAYELGAESLWTNGERKILILTLDNRLFNKIPFINPGWSAQLTGSDITALETWSRKEIQRVLSTDEFLPRGTVLVQGQVYYAPDYTPPKPDPYTAPQPQSQA
jgi:hypothetical protein